MADLQESLEHIGQYAEQWIKSYDFPALTIAVTDRNTLLHQSTHGVTDVRTQTPVTADTLFEIGSIGKPFTNIALLQLQDEGIFDLKKPLEDYLPWFQVQSDFGPVTAHNLMSQTAAIVQGTDLAPHGLYEAWALRNTRTGAPAGEMCSYSNVGYKTLGFLLERLTGLSFDEAIRSRVLDPLGMGQTHPVTTIETREIAASGHTSFYDDRPEHSSHGLVPVSWYEFGTADGCQASTAADMAKYLRMMLNRGKTPTGQVITEDAFGQMTQHVIWTGNDYYGYGLAMYPVQGVGTLIGHGGRTAGFMSAILLDMDAGLGVVALANRNGEPEATLQLARYALSVVRAANRNEGLPPSPPAADPTSISNAVDYAGTYRSSSRTIQVMEQGGKLVLRYNGQDAVLEQRGVDTFYVFHPEFELFLLEFKREQGKVDEAFYGGEWFTGEGYSGPRTLDYPKEWDSYAGHYRARIPQVSNFRVVIQKAALVLVYPTGAVDSLNPLPSGGFRIGDDVRLPDTMNFDAVVDGRALLADYAGCPYYRAFTP